MNSRTVFVLAPNGRRQTVKCNLNTTVLQILDEVCKKQGFNTDEYDIKHHNKILDTNNTIQFSGLPNNAQLELAPSMKTRTESAVLVALNVEDGSRITGTFTPSDTLFDILALLYGNSKPNPVVVYTRREVFGDELSTTSLRSLGITKGRAMLRVIHKTPEELKNQANISAPILPKPVEEQPYKRVFQPIEKVELVKSSEISPETTEEKCETKEVPRSNLNTSKQSNKVDILQLAKKRLKETTENVESSTKTLEPMEDHTSEQTNEPSLEESTDEPTKIKQEHIDIDREFLFIGDRNAMLFSLETAQAIPAEDLPEDFFELTVDDARKILRDIRMRREEAENGAPLLTSQLRNLEESQKQLQRLNKYTKSVIRVLFPDRSVLQGVFAPSDTVNTVMEFVSSYLEDSKTCFYLFSTPPKYVLPKDKLLLEVDCVPGALLRFGTDSEMNTVNNSFLRKDLKDKFTTNSMASLAAIQMREQAKRNKNVQVNEPEPVAGCSGQVNSKKNAGTTGQVPKWFKPTS